MVLELRKLTGGGIRQKRHRMNGKGHCEHIFQEFVGRITRLQKLTKKTTEYSQWSSLSEMSYFS
jgi:hypothetical protein